MNEMQLFEVGFQESFRDSGYHAKFYVAAKSDLEARKKALEFVQGDKESIDDVYPEYTLEEWLKDECEDSTEETYKRYMRERERYIKKLKNLLVTRIHHLGLVVV